MNSDGTMKDNLRIGMNVEVNPQSDRTRKQLVKGEIAEILSNTPEHTHGILVKLSSGDVGRVKNILLQDDNIDSESDNNAVVVNSDDFTISDIIKEGENHTTEFKTSSLWSLNYSPKAINESNSKEVKQYGRLASIFIIAKTLSGFLNSDGGTLIIGVKENKNDQPDEIIGIESEFIKLTDPCIDGYRRMILDKIIKPYFPKNIFHHLNYYLQIDFEVINEVTVCRVRASKSDVKVFLKINKTDLFFVRIDASTRELHGEDIVNYCTKRFSS